MMKSPRLFAAAFAVMASVAGHPDVRYWFDTYTPQFENVIMPASAEQMLMAGVTTVGDLAAPPREIIAVRKRIADGACRSAPRVISAIGGNDLVVLVRARIVIRGAVDDPPSQQVHAVLR